jgi:hypothetical protein
MLILISVDYILKYSWSNQILQSASQDKSFKSENIMDV